MLKDLKELSDGEIKVAISTVNMMLEVRVGIGFFLGGWRILQYIFYSVSQRYSFVLNASL